MTNTTLFDAADYLETAEDIAIFLDEVLAGGDRASVAHALGIASRAKGMSAVAAQAGMSLEALDRALCEDGDPKLSTLLGVLSALGLRLTAAPRPKPRPLCPDAG